MKGLFVLRRSDSYWRWIFSNLYIEQVLKSTIKSVGGLTQGCGFDNSRPVWSGYCLHQHVEKCTRPYKKLLTCLIDMQKNYTKTEENREWSMVPRTCISSFSVSLRQNILEKTGQNYVACNWYSCSQCGVSKRPSSHTGIINLRPCWLWESRDGPKTVVSATSCGTNRQYRYPNSFPSLSYGHIQNHSLIRSFWCDKLTERIVRMLFWRKRHQTLLSKYLLMQYMLSMEVYFYNDYHGLCLCHMLISHICTFSMCAIILLRHWL